MHQHGGQYETCALSPQRPAPTSQKSLQIRHKAKKRAKTDNRQNQIREYPPPQGKSPIPALKELSRPFGRCFCSNCHDFERRGVNSARTTSSSRKTVRIGPATTRLNSSARITGRAYVAAR